MRNSLWGKHVGLPTLLVYFVRWQYKFVPTLDTPKEWHFLLPNLI